MNILGKRSVLSVLKVLVNIVLYLQYFGAFVLVLLFVVSVFGDWEGTDNLVLPVHFSESHPLPEVEISSIRNEDATLHITDGELHFTPNNSPLWWVMWLVILVVALFTVGYTILITLSLRKFFRALNEGVFFTLQNARQLRILALLIAFIAPLEFLGKLINNFIISTHFELGGMALSADFNFPLLFVGMVLLVFSELFKAGAKLQEEYDYTI